MSTRVAGPLLFAAALLYLGAFGLAINRYDYDTWGAFVVIPPLLVLGTVGLRFLFRGEHRHLATIMVAGLFVKFVGAAARYYVSFEAYGGVTDANRYHRTGTAAVLRVRDGEGILSLIPSGTGTPFMEELTGVFFYVFGTSKLGAFFVFAWLAYWGTAFFVKAAVVAIPGLLDRRYALLCVLAPSVMYWPSSIGKEAWMYLTLGLASYGFALVLSRRGVLVPVIFGALGMLGAGLVRPHMVGLWLAGAIPALLIGVLAGRSGADLGGVLSAATSRRPRAGERIALLGVVVIAAIGLTVAAGATVRYLNPDDEQTGTDAVTSILDETTRRTLQAGSNFQPPNIDNPANWPYAIIRTLTRPLPHEARGLGQLIAAGEMTLYVGIALLSWRRFANLPRVVLRNRYVSFSVSVLLLGGLAYSSFANLGVLTRQKSLLFPFLLLLLALPTRREDQDRADAAAEKAAVEELRREVEAARRRDGASVRFDRPVEVPAQWHGERGGASASVVPAHAAWGSGSGGPRRPAARPWEPSRPRESSRRVDVDGGWVSGTWAPPSGPPGFSGPS